MKIPTIGDAVPKQGNAFSRLLGRLVLLILGWRVEGELPNLSKFVIIAAPHTSNWDFIVGMGALLALGISVNWLGKHTIFRWPVTKLWRWLGGIPINRELHHGTVDQIVDLFNTRQQMTLGLSPEGTRKKVDQWKTGFYQIATHANVPILLVAFDYATKTLKIGPTMVPTDLPKDIVKIREFYSGVRAKYPESFSLPS